MCAEAAWILSGDNRVDTIAPFSRMISKFSDDGLTFSGAYGPPIIDQLPYIINSILVDQFTRQAVLTIWRQKPGVSKDIPCTISAQWVLRKNEQGAGRLLHCFVNMRSSDVWLGVPYDWFNFTMISGFILLGLKWRSQSGLFDDAMLGNLYFTAGSQHLYEQHWEQGKNCVFKGEPLFSYEPFNTFGYYDAPYKLVDHLWAVARGKKDLVTTGFLYELFDLKKLRSSDDVEEKPRGYE